MSEMIERVARALALSRREIPDDNAGFLLEPDRRIWQNYISHARAAIEAMREPTKQMVAAGDAAEPHYDGTAIADIYAAMIDEALK